MTTSARKSGPNAALQHYVQVDREPDSKVRIFRKTFEPIHEMMPCAPTRKSPLELIRDEGFVAVRLSGGRILARLMKDNRVALDAYMAESGQYSALAHNWLKLKSLVPEIRNATSVLDVTCGTGISSTCISSARATRP